MTDFPVPAQNNREKEISLLGKTARGLKRGIVAVSSAVNLIGMAVMIIIVLLVVADVISRRAFNLPIVGVLEITKVGLLLIVFLTLAYCGLKGGHVEVETIVAAFPKRLQSAVVGVMYILSTAMLGVACWQLIVQGMDMHSAGQTTGILKMVIYPFLYIAAFGTALLALVYLVRFFDLIREVQK